MRTAGGCCGASRRDVWWPFLECNISWYCHINIGDGWFIRCRVHHPYGWLELWWGLWMSVDSCIPLDGPVAHGYLIRAVHAPRTVVHQHSKRLRCEWHLAPSQLAAVDLDLSMMAVCKCPVSLLNDCELTQSDLFYVAMFPGVRRATQGQHGPRRCQGEQRRERGRGGRADGRDGHQRGIRGRDTHTFDQATERGENGGRSNRTGRLLPQLPDNVRSVSPSFVSWLIFFAFFAQRVDVMGAFKCGWFLGLSLR